MKIDVFCLNLISMFVTEGPVTNKSALVRAMMAWPWTGKQDPFH